ncbi:MAG: signal recognition particle-docking protein FtsY [Actinobacteria bacterium]|nr:signal recognition particle-docking protein FtsY [Actinomycetota bacterium]
MSLLSRFTSLFTREDRASVDWQDLEATLIASDIGPTLAKKISDRLHDEKKLTLEVALGELLISADRSLVSAESPPTVILVVGVNGSGKTTSVGKLAARLHAQGASVVVVAADTFRAAAREQLQTWATRIGVTCVGGKDGADPAAVAFDGVSQAVDQGADYVIIDTAGRLQTKEGLMDQLGKIRRVVEKKAPVSEVLLVLDGSTGQNALSQGASFTSAVQVTGLVLTKLDGSSKGGAALAIEATLGIPIKLIGTGEGLSDIAPFEPDSYIAALVGR